LEGQQGQDSFGAGWHGQRSRTVEEPKPAQQPHLRNMQCHDHPQPAGATSSSQQVTLPFTGLAGPYAVAVDGSGDVYVADSFNSRVVELPAAPALTVAMGLPQTGVVGVPFSESLTALGGTPPYTWSLVSGSLPAGLSLSTSGVISGTPTAAGTSSFTAQVADSSLPPQTATDSGLSITVLTPLAVTTSTLPGGQVGTAYSQTLAATGGTTPYTWSVVSGSLPAGLSLSTSGVISGTPTAAGPSSFTVQVADSSRPQMTATASLSITVGAPLAVTTSILPAATLGTAYSATLAATGGTTPYTWSVVSGSLPPGLSLAGSTGVISGTPVLAGAFAFTVQAADSSSPQMTATAQLSITVGGCTTTITGTHSGPLTIGSGTTCLDQATVTGPVHITTGAVVSITGSKLDGPLSASSPGSLAVCGTAVSGPVSVSDATGAVLLGGTSTSPCGSDSFGGLVTLSANTAGVTLAGSTVTGPATVNSNSGGTVVAGNTIGGPLSCSGNNPPPTDEGQPNAVSGPATGQCSTLA
jgi:hypothetical protein